MRLPSAVCICRLMGLPLAYATAGNVLTIGAGWPRSMGRKLELDEPVLPGVVLVSSPCVALAAVSAPTFPISRPSDLQPSLRDSISFVRTGLSSATTGSTMICAVRPTV